jgi:hypothetical protein
MVIAQGFEPKQQVLVAKFRKEVAGRPDDTINRMIYGYYRDAAGEDLIVDTPTRYARAGLVQYAVEYGHRVRCRLVRRAIDDITFCLGDKAYAASWVGEYQWRRIAVETQNWLKKQVANHSAACPSDCAVKV